MNRPMQEQMRPKGTRTCRPLIKTRLEETRIGILPGEGTLADHGHCSADLGIRIARSALADRRGAGRHRDPGGPRLGDSESEATATIGSKTPRSHGLVRSESQQANA